MSRGANRDGVLPQWAFERVLRPSFRAVARAAWRMRFAGTHHIPPIEAGGLVIAANHQTYFDPFWLSIPVRRRVRYLAWDAAFEWFVVGRMIRRLGAIPLALEGGDRKAMRRALDTLRAGDAVVIFPEGGRGNTDGTPLRFKPGAVRLALEAGVPILPVTISGAHKVWNSAQLIPRPAPVSITYHPPRIMRCPPDEDTRLFARRESDELARVIASAL